MRFLVALSLLLGTIGSAQAQDEPDRGDFRILVISDLNSSFGSTSYEWQVDSTIARIPRLWQPDMVLTGGDMIAGQSTSLTDENVRAMWAAFDEYVAAPLRELELPLGFTIGNHDASASPTFQRDRELAEEYWLESAHHPGINFVDSTHFPFYFTFEQDSIFFLAWDASSATVQNLAWVEQALQSEEAASARMRIAVGHLPLYAVASGRNTHGEVLNQPETLRSLLQEYDVHTYVSGHHHAYYPGRRGSLQLLHAGALGQGERSLIGRSETSPNTLTILDIDLDAETTRYTTLDATTLDTIDATTLPKAIQGVNGFVVRRDVGFEGEYTGSLSPLHVAGNVSSDATGSVSGSVESNTLHIEGSFEGLSTDLAENDGARAAVFAGVNGRSGTRVADLNVTSDDGRSGALSGQIELDPESGDLLLAGSYYVVVFTSGYPEGELRGHLLSGDNAAPGSSTITSPDDGESIVVTDAFGQLLYKAEWTAVSDSDGDPVTYTYQIAGDADFDDIWLSEYSSLSTDVSMSRRILHALLVDHGIEEGSTATLYHRAVTSDGSLVTYGDAASILVSNGEPTSVENEGNPADFVLEAAYPNPASSEVQLRFRQDRRARVAASVYNALGQQVQRADLGWVSPSLHEISLDVGELPAGVYLVQIVQAGPEGTRRSSSRTLTVY